MVQVFGRSLGVVLVWVIVLTTAFAVGGTLATSQPVEWAHFSKYGAYVSAVLDFDAAKPYLVFGICILIAICALLVVMRYIYVRDLLMVHHPHYLKLHRISSIAALWVLFSILGVLWFGMEHNNALHNIFATMLFACKVFQVMADTYIMRETNIMPEIDVRLQLFHMGAAIFYWAYFAIVGFIFLTFIRPPPPDVFHDTRRRGLEISAAAAEYLVLVHVFFWHAQYWQPLYSKSSLKVSLC